MIRFQNQIRVFKWTGSEELERINISDHLSPFMVYKINYDIGDIVKIQQILASEPDISTKELRERLEYPNTMLRTLLGYKDQISGIGRNAFLLND
ncbi:hypothetical protein [Ferdinandcohnia sp. SAFN-114]|uniref:hypothetical protein n=1 Tax=Ferdinandcohnia sp. SAFN-114 TaxID=3387275 RepID=UPI003F7D49C1